MFTLLFLIVVLASLVVVILAIIHLVRGRFKQAGRLLARYGIGLATYLGVVVIVALLSPQRIVVPREDRCFDDWCIAVEDVTLTNELGQAGHGVFYVITLRLSNHARGRDQRASSTAIHLLDDQGRSYDLSPLGQALWEAQHGPTAPLTSTIAVGQSLTTVQVFELPRDANDVALTIEHPVGPSPGLFIIGDEASLFHKPTIVRLR